MTRREGLQQLKASLRFLSAIVVLNLLFVLCRPGLLAGISLAIFGAFWILEVVLILRMTRRAASDPSYLDENIE